MDTVVCKFINTDDILRPILAHSLFLLSYIWMTEIPVKVTKPSILGIVVLIGFYF